MLFNMTQGTLEGSGRCALTGATTSNKPTLSSGLSTPGIVFEWKIANGNSIPYYKKM